MPFRPGPRLLLPAPSIPTKQPGYRPAVTADPDRRRRSSPGARALAGRGWCEYFWVQRLVLPPGREQPGDRLNITGTRPPYDRTIVLGPSQPKQTARTPAAALGVAGAVVYVNDLGRVKVLASVRAAIEGAAAAKPSPNPAATPTSAAPLVVVRRA